VVQGTHWCCCPNTPGIAQPLLLGLEAPVQEKSQQTSSQGTGGLLDVMTEEREDKNQQKTWLVF